MKREKKWQSAMKKSGPCKKFIYTMRIKEEKKREQRWQQTNNAEQNYTVACFNATHRVKHWAKINVYVASRALLSVSCMCFAAK